MNWRLAVTIVITALATLAAAALLMNIFERKQEARSSFFRVVELNESIDDPAVWGKNFPLQYDDYLKTVDQTRSRYGGSEALPHSPTNGDPRSVVARSKLEEDPRLKTMWAGYAFSVDYRERRGHAYMLIDQRSSPTFRSRARTEPTRRAGARRPGVTRSRRTRSRSWSQALRPRAVSIARRVWTTAIAER